MRKLTLVLSAAPLLALLLLTACDDPVMDAARAADFHATPAAFISEVVRPDDAKRRDLTLRVNFTDGVTMPAILAVMHTAPGIYQGTRPFVWFRPPESMLQGTMNKCRRVQSLVGGPPVESCEESSKYLEAVYKIWPDKGSPPRPYRTKTEAVSELRFRLKRFPQLELFYCGRTPNSCEPLVLPAPPADKTAKS